MVVLLFCFAGLFVPPGHIDTLFLVQALYPEPRTRPRYAYIVILSQCAQSVDSRSVQAYKTPNSCGDGLLCNLFGVRPIPTVYSLCALNPHLPGLEPGPAPLALAQVCVIRVNANIGPLCCYRGWSPPVVWSRSVFDRLRVLYSPAPTPATAPAPAHIKSMV